MAGRHDRVASILGICSCVAQGVLPLGAQILLAGSLAGLSPLSIAGKVWYCWLLAVVAIGFMLWPSRDEPDVRNVDGLSGE